MVKVLSQAGMSLADVYNVVGSVAGIDQLESREVSLVHEMGATIFSERFQTTIRRVESAALLQSTTFSLAITNMPASITRLLAIVVTADDGSRIARCTVSIRDPDDAGGTEIPIWVWDGTTLILSRFEDQGAVIQPDLLVGSAPTIFLPTFTGGSGQGLMPTDISMRGVTTAFGAGNVTIRLHMLVAFAFQRGLSSTGLPIPGW